MRLRARYPLQLEAARRPAQRLGGRLLRIDQGGITMRSPPGRHVTKLDVTREYEPSRLQGEAAAAAYQALFPVRVCQRRQKSDLCDDYHDTTTRTFHSTSKAAGA